MGMLDIPVIVTAPTGKAGYVGCPRFVITISSQQVEIFPKGGCLI